MRAGACATAVLMCSLAFTSHTDAQQPAPAPAPAPPPLAPAALSVPNPLAGLRPGPRDLYQSPDGSDRFQHLSPHPATSPPFIFPGVYFPGPYYPAPYYPGSYYPGQSYPGVSLAQIPVAHAAPRGRLTLETIPVSAQVYIDGFYVGTAGEFGLQGRALDLTAGSHRVELRAPEFETTSFSVMIAPNETLRYRGDMQRLSASQPRLASLPARPQQQTRNVYVIPKCYAGDKPPATRLPAGCNPKNVQTQK